MRIVNRLLAVVLGLLLAAAGVVLVVEAALAWLDRPPEIIDRGRIASTLAELQWTDPLVLWTSLGLVGVGLLLLVLQLVPRRQRSVPMQAHGDGAYTAAVDRGELAAWLSEVAADDDQVTRARASVKGRNAAVRVSTIPGAPVDAVRDRVRDRVQRALDNFEPTRGVSPRVSVTPGRAREPEPAR